MWVWAHTRTDSFVMLNTFFRMSCLLKYEMTISSSHRWNHSDCYKTEIWVCVITLKGSPFVDIESSKQRIVINIPIGILKEILNLLNKE